MVRKLARDRRRSCVKNGMMKELVEATEEGSDPSCGGSRKGRRAARRQEPRSTLSSSLGKMIGRISPLKRATNQTSRLLGGKSEKSEKRAKQKIACVFSCVIERRGKRGRPFADATGTNEGYNHPAECSGEGCRGAGMLRLIWNDLVH